MSATASAATILTSADSAPLARREPTPPDRQLTSVRWQDALLAAIIGSLVYGAIPALEAFGLKFFVSNVWNPVTHQFGALAPIYGTLVTSAIALVIGIPVSFGIALFLTEMCPPILKRPLGTAVELLAAIPSIIYGMWGLFVFAPIFADTIQPALGHTLGKLWLIGP